MQLVNRFSFRTATSIIRNIVTQDEEGFFHIAEEIFCDPDKVDAQTQLRKHTATRFDLHGKMTAEDYAAWLTNALFNQVYVNADPLEKQWLMET